MMKAEDFYSTLEKFEPLFKESGLKKKTRSVYVLPNNVRLQFILNKWGWIEDEGWGFIVRLSDLNKTDKYGNVLGWDNELDLKPHILVKEKLLSQKEIKELSEGQPAKVINDFKDGWWYTFYDQKHLFDLLDKTLPIILGVALQWAKERPPTPSN
jgi:hypothetical protein